MFIRDKTKLETTVIECYEYNDKIFVILEDTIFYAESGGQICDFGTINDADVLDVFYHENNIVHEVSKQLSGNVTCILDEERRYKNSLLHTAQHLFSAVVEKDGVDTTSFYMREDYFVIDVMKKVSREELDTYENIINEKIRYGICCKCRMYDSNIDSGLDISYLNEDEKNIRIMEMGDYVKDVCGGTHVSNINEIKYLKVISHKYSNEKTKVTVFIGNKAIDHVNKYYRYFQDVIRLLNQDEDDVVEKLEEKLRENKKLSKEVKKYGKMVKNESFKG